MIIKKPIRYFLCLLSGLIMAAGWSDYHTGYAAFFGLIPLLLLAEHYRRQTERVNAPSVFFFSWFAFFIFNLISTWWIWHSSEVGAIMAVVFNSLFMAIVFWLYYVISRRMGLRTGLWSLVILWLGFEYLHTNWDLSWPWLTLGNAMSGNVRFIQWYEFTGVFGGSLWILLINIFLFLAIKQALTGEKKTATQWFTASALTILLPIIFSLVMYHNYEEKGEKAGIVVVQPNIDPYNEKFGGMSMAEQLIRFTHLAAEKINDSTVFVVGPETHLPNGMWEESLTEHPHFRFLLDFVKAHPQITLITGMSSYREFLPGEKLTPTARKFRDGDGYYESYNTALCFDTACLPQLYHKSKLVLGVEIMPFPETLGFLGELSVDLGGTSGGLGHSPEPIVFTERSGRFRPAPVICYESVYGEYVTGYISKGANFIFVITNDGWWGNSPGHRQHLRLSSLRAIESRRSVARSANTGISCFINQRGDIIDPTGYWVPAAVKGTIKANEELTVYVKYGDYIGRAASLLSVLVLLYYFSVRMMRRKIK